jgi:hypothetical protein
MCFFCSTREGDFYQSWVDIKTTLRLLDRAGRIRGRHTYTVHHCAHFWAISGCMETLHDAEMFLEPARCLTAGWPREYCQILFDLPAKNLNESEFDHALQQKLKWSLSGSGSIYTYLHLYFKSSPHVWQFSMQILWNHQSLGGVFWYHTMSPWVISVAWEVSATTGGLDSCHRCRWRISSQVALKMTRKHQESINVLIERSEWWSWWWIDESLNHW